MAGGPTGTYVWQSLRGELVFGPIGAGRYHRAA